MKRRLIAAVLLLTLTLVIYGFAAYVWLAPTSGDATVPTDEDASLTTSEGTLTVWFLDVGQADSALLLSDGEYMLIDGGNVDDGRFLVSFLQKQGVEELEAVVCTHAHEDHVGGLAAVLAVFPTETVYAPTTSYDSTAFESFLRYVNRQGLEITIPDAGDSFTLGDATLTVLGPLADYEETNNTSLVLRAQLGEIRFLFTGDQEREAETDLLDAETDLRADVLKVGHHGSADATGYRFLYEVAPTYAVISCGVDNAYGHPHEETLSRLHDEGAVLYRTDTLGTVRADTDGTSVTFSWENSSVQPETGEAVPEQYIGNTRSLLFHAANCDSLPSERNRVTFDSYDEAVAAGYHPHDGCVN